MLAKLRAAAKARGIDVDRIRGMGSRPRDEHGEPIPPASSLLGMSESFSAHSGEPVDRRLPAGKEGSSVGRSTASSDGWSTRRPARRWRQARSASCSSAAAA